MILFLAVILGLVVSLVRHRGNTASQLGAISLRSGWLALAALALQVPLLASPWGPRQQVLFPQVLFLLSHLLLLAFIWRNRRLRGIPLLAVGVCLNLLVVVVNGGLMPISPQTLLQINPGSTPEQWPVGFHYGTSKDVILLREDTNLWVLSDILVLPPPLPWPTAFSLGDVLIAVGIVVLLQGPGASRAKARTEARLPRAEAVGERALTVYHSGQQEVKTHEA